MEITNPNKERRDRRKPSVDLSTMVYGKVPPQARDLEEAVLGACLLETDAYQRIADILKPQCFYVDAHQVIFRAIGGLWDKRSPVDSLTVVEWLKASEELDRIGGPYYVTKLTDAVMGSANLEAHARIIQQKFVAREVIRISGELIGYAYEDANQDLNLMMDAASEAFYSLQADVYKGALHSWAELMGLEVEQLDQEMRKEGITGVPTGYRRVDKVTAGWQNTDLIILAARPSMGKTALAGKMAYRSAKIYRVPTLFFSLEMNADKLAKRIISSETEIPLSKSLHNWFNESEKDQIREFADETGSVPLYVDDDSHQTLSSIRAISRKEKKKRNIGLIIIDYLQLLHLTNEEVGKQTNRDQEIGIITSSLKQLAKELDLPIIALSQLARAAEASDSKRPSLKHLRESGNIEQDADIVAFLHRPYYYLQREQPGQIFDEHTRRGAELIFAKHRNGPLETIDLLFDDQFASFREFEDEIGLPF